MIACGFFEGSGLPLRRARQVGDLAVAFRKIALGFDQPLLDAGQARRHRLFENGSGVDRTLERRRQRFDVRFETVDARIAPVEIDHLPRRGEPGLFERHLLLMNFKGVLRPQPILVGADLDVRHRHGFAEPARCQPHRARPETGSGKEPQQTSDQKAERQEEC